MAGLKITIEFPEELVKRAESVGVKFETQTDQIISMIDSQFRRQLAAQHLTEIVEQF
jgi:hypothetical protein